MLLATRKIMCAMGKRHRTHAVKTCRAASSHPKLILGIETSCDDTGVAVVSSDGRVLGEALATQEDIHAAWGGVVPNLAMEAHKAAIDSTVDLALSRAGISASQLDAVACTIGPGLSLCLRVGVLKARQIARQHQLPVIGVHHMEGHALVSRLPPQDMAGPTPSDPSVSFPFLCLLVSGGHNLILLVHGVGKYVQIGTTVDDALGEAYDKVARLLGLELKPSGGAALEALAAQGDPKSFPFAVPMRKHINCDFSYAGLKTGVRLAIEQAVRMHGVEQEKEEGPSGSTGSTCPLPIKMKADIAASFQQVACLHLIERMKRAVQWARETEPGLKSLVVAGGVASNKYIRSQLYSLCTGEGLELVLPPPKWCTDNGVMIAWAGIERMNLGHPLDPPPPPLDSSDPLVDHAGGANANAAANAAGEFVELRPRWPLTSDMHPRCLPGHEKIRSLRKARVFTSLSDIDQGQGQGQGQAQSLAASQ